MFRDAPWGDVCVSVAGHALFGTRHFNVTVVFAHRLRPVISWSRGTHNISCAPVPLQRRPRTLFVLLGCCCVFLSRRNVRCLQLLRGALRQLTTEFVPLTNILMMLLETMENLEVRYCTLDSPHACATRDNVTSAHMECTTQETALREISAMWPASWAGT